LIERSGKLGEKLVHSLHFRRQREFEPERGDFGDAAQVRHMPHHRAGLSELTLSFGRLRQQRRDELEAAPGDPHPADPIEGTLGLTEPPRMRLPSRRRPLDA
jgi:hypothetical protein